MLNKRRCSSLLALYLILGCWKGYLALFEKGEAEPKQIYPAQVCSLPPADRAALELGIPVRNQKALEQLLEDFLS